MDGVIPQNLASGPLAHPCRFAEHMPSFHFSTQRVFLDRPTPLLLAAILYASATQHPMTHFARHAPFYQNVVARAIAELCIPKQEAAAFRNQVEEYHNALGVVIAGLMCNASVATTGLWISMAYQMIVHGSEAGSGVKSSEWRGLYEGLRVSPTLAESDLMSGYRHRARLAADDMSASAALATTGLARAVIFHDPLASSGLEQSDHDHARWALPLLGTESSQCHGDRARYPHRQLGRPRSFRSRYAHDHGLGRRA